jgi:hypothetical protein
MRSVDIYAEFVVAVSEVLDERVPGTDHPRSRVRPRIGRSRAFRSRDRLRRIHNNPEELEQVGDAIRAVCEV